MIHTFLMMKAHAQCCETDQRLLFHHRQRLIKCWKSTRWKSLTYLNINTKLFSQGDDNHTQNSDNKWPRNWGRECVGKVWNSEGTYLLYIFLQINRHFVKQSCFSVIRNARLWNECKILNKWNEKGISGRAPTNADLIRKVIFFMQQRC